MDLLVQRALRMSPAFARCPDAALREMGRGATVQRYGKGEGIRGSAKNGEREDVLLVVAGRLRLHRQTGNGRSSVLSFVGPAHVLTNLGDAQRAGGLRFEYVAHENSTLVHVPFQALQSALKGCPEHWRDLVWCLIEQKRRLAMAVAGQSCGSAMNRLAWILLSHLRQDLGADMAICHSQEDLGSLARLCRQTTNSALQRLERAGAIRQAYGRVFVLSEPMLWEFASRDSTERPRDRTADMAIAA